MSPPFGSLERPRLTFEDVVRRARTAPPPARAGERCDLCGEPVADEHGHVVDVTTSEVMCACRPCSLLFDRDAAGGGHFRLVPDRREPVEGLAVDDEAWDRLGVPVGLAFFSRRSTDDAVSVVYPGPAGTVSSSVDAAIWEELVGAHPVLADLAPDVEGLLVNRARGAREAWVAPIGDCYRLAALIRRHWEGMGGGPEVWERVRGFFDELAAGGPRPGPGGGR